MTFDPKSLVNTLCGRCSLEALDVAIRLLETGTESAAWPWRNSGGGGKIEVVDWKVGLPTVAR